MKIKLFQIAQTIDLAKAKRFVKTFFKSDTGQMGKNAIVSISFNNEDTAFSNNSNDRSRQGAAFCQNIFQIRHRESW